MAIQIGKQAPDFELPSSEGGSVGLSDLEGKYAIIYFYPRDNTPGCTAEARAFRDARDKLDELGAVIVGVSKDSLESHRKFREKHGLDFPLLSDASGEMIEKYGAWGEKKLYGKTSMGIIRSTVVLGPDGKVVAHFPKVKVAGHVEAVTAAIEAERAK